MKNGGILMEVVAVSYKNFKEKLQIIKQLRGYRVEDLDGIIIAQRKIELN